MTKNDKPKDHNFFTSNYERYCNEIDREDRLINERINWLLASQSIFFAAVAFAENKIQTGPLVVLAWLGCFTSLLFWISIDGAIRSMGHYRNELKKVCKPECDPNNCFPQLHRKPSNLEKGLLAAKSVPLLFSIGWIVLGVVKLVSIALG